MIPFGEGPKFSFVIGIPSLVLSLTAQQRLLALGLSRLQCARLT